MTISSSRILSAVSSAEFSPSSMAAWSSARSRGLMMSRKLFRSRRCRWRGLAQARQAPRLKEAHHAVDLSGRLESGNQDFLGHRVGWQHVEWPDSLQRPQR